MSLSFRPLPSLLLFALLGAGSVAVAGPQRHPQDPALAPPSTQERPRRARPAPLLPDRPAPARGEDGLSDSVRKIERSTRGQVLSAERVPYEGRNLNRIKVVDDRGRVRVYMDDPTLSGSTLSGSTQSNGRPPPAGTPTRGDDD
jgi:hypothetical protein